jgi:glycosyltransferase involved in cell wall biosynthesis
MLFFVRERYPTFRPDIEALFFGEMLNRGLRIDFVMQGEPTTRPGTVRLAETGAVLVGRAVRGGGPLPKIVRILLALAHDLTSLVRVLRSPYDCLQYKDKFLTAAIGVCVAKMKGIRYFYWLSFPFPEARKYQAKIDGRARAVFLYLRGAFEEFLLYRVILPACDHAFVQSPRMRADVAKRGIPVCKLTAVPMGVRLEQFEPRSEDAPSAQRAGATFVIGYLGTITAERRLGVLLEMLSRVRHELGIDADLLFVGAGERRTDEEALLRQARELNVQDHFRITGFLPREQALELLRGADVCVSPFYPTPILLSTSPTKLIEYMALEIPVIANEHPDQSAVINESGAGVCVPWGAEPFADAAASIYHMSAGRRRELGRRGRAWVASNRAYSRIADDLARKYEDLLHGKELGEQLS